MPGYFRFLTIMAFDVFLHEKVRFHFALIYVRTTQTHFVDLNNIYYKFDEAEHRGRNSLPLAVTVRDVNNVHVAGRGTRPATLSR